MKEIAIRAAKSAGKILSDNFSNKFIVKTKNNHHQVVTDADHLSQKTISKIIKSSYPAHSIFDEESKEYFDKSAEYNWIIDPLDGSANYVSKNSYFCVSIALQHNLETILGIVYSPITKELFVAEKGKGAFLNNKKIQISGPSQLKDAVICIDWSHYRGENKEKAKDILYVFGKEARKVSSYGAGALSAAQVSIGRFDAYFSIQSNPWDHAAAALIVQEAGGIATTANGEKQVGFTNSIFVSNREIHYKLFKVLRNLNKI